LVRDFHRPDPPSFLRHPFGPIGRFAGQESRPAVHQLRLSPRLRSRLNLGGLAFPRNPWAYGECVSHTLCATHADILTSLRSTEPRGSTSPPRERSPTDERQSRPSRGFGDMLSRRSGLFPSRPRNFSPAVSLPRFDRSGIRSLVEFGSTPVPRVHPELYPRLSFYEAAPKCISGIISYYRTRLAFHSYPQVNRDFFNRHRFGPPPRYTGASTCSWIDRTASGSSPETRRPVQTRFPCGSGPPTDLNLATDDESPAHFTKGTPSPSTPSRTIPAPIACRHTGSGLFTPRQGCI